MKIKYLLEQLRGRDGETIAVFGAARLVKHLDGKIQLIGGTPEDRRAAREWCSMFLHEAAVACFPAPESAAKITPCAMRLLPVVTTCICLHHTRADFCHG